MKEDRALNREEIEDILDRFHIQEYEWFIDDKDDPFCSSSEEDAELIEKAIKGLINQYKTDYISKDKIRKELLEPIKEELSKLGETFMNKDPEILTRSFEVEGTAMQELSWAKGRIEELLEE